MESVEIRVLNWLTSQISPRPLGLARIIIGGAAVIRGFITWPILTKLAQPETLRAPYFDWTPDPSIGLAVLICGVWLVAAVAFAAGVRVWLTGTLLWLSMALTLSLDIQTYANHLYLLTWLVLLLTIADAGAGLSIRRSERQVIRWPVNLLMLQASIVYGFTALTKMNADFLTGRVLAGVLRDGLISFPDSWRTQSFLTVLSIMAVIVELFLAMFLWSPRRRPAAFILGLGLHGAITLLMTPTWDLVVFSLGMFALYPLFLIHEPMVVIWDDDCGSCRDWIHRFQRFDLLSTLQPIGKSDAEHLAALGEVEQSLHLIHAGETTRGFAAITRILEHLVPTFWFAPILRMPGVRSLGERWYRWQAARRSCAVGLSHVDV